MNNNNETGPSGHRRLAGRRRGRCPDTATTTAQETKTTESPELNYGLGRGGKPRGGGKGHCHAGKNANWMGGRWNAEEKG